jgi:hypothetical protein
MTGLDSGRAAPRISPERRSLICPTGLAIAVFGSDRCLDCPFTMGKWGAPKNQFCQRFQGLTVRHADAVEFFYLRKSEIVFSLLHPVLIQRDVTANRHET